jgi:hypothetical protein
MVLPEHRARMVEQELYQTRYVERPELDEDAMEEMQRTVQDAMARGAVLTIRVYQDGGIHEVAMVPKWLQQDRLKGHTVGGMLQAVELVDIVGVGIN